MKNNMLIKYNVLVLGTLLMAACSSQPAQNDNTTVTDSIQVITSDYSQTTSDVSESASPRMTSKGVIESEQDVPVFSRMSSVIQRLSIHEGDRVSAGQTLVLLDSIQQSHNVQLYSTQYESAKFQYKSILAGQGYDDNKEDLIPEHIKKAARTRSQLDLYQVQLEDAKTLLSYTKIKAPVSGIVTDLRVACYDLAQEGNPLFRIVNPNQLVVNFTILESELSHFSVGTEVRVTPIAYPDEVHKATVLSISPKVDVSGMVRVKARITDTTHLLVGMSALVAI